MIDLYCERTGPGLWAEPLNVATSLAYAAAAWGLWRNAARTGADARAAGRTLAAMALAIAVGSVLFHTVATPAARMCDETPILIFQLTFLWCYGRRILGSSAPATVVALGGFIAAVGAARLMSGVMNGSLPYVPAFVVMLAIGIRDARTDARSRVPLVAVAVLFGIAVLFRTVDNAWCGAFPYGTHFIWHLLTAYVLYAFGSVLSPLRRA